MIYFQNVLAENENMLLEKTSGKANIEKPSRIRFQLNLRDLKLVTQRIIELGDKKETVTKEDLPISSLMF
jgi:D-citramalate synthase